VVVISAGKTFAVEDVRQFDTYEDGMMFCFVLFKQLIVALCISTEICIEMKTVKHRCAAKATKENKQHSTANSFIMHSLRDEIYPLTPVRLACIGVF